MSGSAVPRATLAPEVEIPRWINGGWQLAEGHRLTPGRSEKDELSGLVSLVDRGLNTFDCADIYTGVEERLGALRHRLLAERGTASIRVHTKLVPDLGALPTLDRAAIERIVDRSRARLGVERLDLVQFHWWDWTVPRWLEVASWLESLRNRGAVAHLGVTNFDAEHLEPLLSHGAEWVSNQVQYSLLDRRPTRGTAELCRQHGMVLLVYGALAGGFLTDRWLGQADPGARLANRSLVKYRLVIEEYGGWSAFQQLLSRLRRIADKHEVSIAAVALRWVLDRPGVAAVIVGAGSVARTEENLRCFDFELDDEDHDDLAVQLAAHPGPPGDVYSVERIPGGRHAAIMKTDLHQEGR